MKAILIINPMSGKTKRKMPPILKWTFKKLKRKLRNLSKPKTTVEEIVKEVEKVCSGKGIKLDIEYTKYPKHAIKLARAAKDKYDLVIVAGGDGTVNEVINGIANSKTTLAIIPFGSTNVLALELGIPFNVKKASELIAHGKKSKIDLGYAKTGQEGRFFSMMMGIGFVPTIIKKAGSKFKKRWGRMAFPLAGIRQLFSYKWQKIHVDHKSHSVGYFVVISNSKFYGGEYQIADKASMTDGLLDLVIINRHNWWRIIKIISSLSTGKLNKFLRGEYHQTKEAHIYSRHKMLVQVDGELIGSAPVRVKVAPNALTILVNK